MKKLILPLAMLLLAIPLTMEAQTVHKNELEQRIQTLEDRSALKTLVDTFSELADKRYTKASVALHGGCGGRLDY